MLCKKCGRKIVHRAWEPDKENLARWERRGNRAILRHAWEYHREDFPDRFRTFTEFIKWYTTPEGKEWDYKQGLIAEAERIVQGEK